MNNKEYPYRARKKRKSSAVSNILLIIAILLLVAGGALLLIDPIKAHRRQEKVDEAFEAIREQITLEDTDKTAMTFVVPATGNEIDGEDYDYFGNDDEILRQQEEVATELASYGDTVTLNGIGIIDIDSVDIHLPIWDEASVLTLRYGAGHYNDSVMPGEAGNCTVLAHHMRETGSMFNRLDEVQIGDVIRIVTVNGSSYEYIADEIKIVTAQELENLIGADASDTARITLVTCTYTSEGKKRLLVCGYLRDD